MSLQTARATWTDPVYNVSECPLYATKEKPATEAAFREGRPQRVPGEEWKIGQPEKPVMKGTSGSDDEGRQQDWV